MDISGLSNEEKKEIILAQDQSVTITGASDVGGKMQGTLILTNLRLLFVVANQEQDLLLTPFPRDTAGLRFADVDDLNRIAPNKYNLSIPLRGLELEEGREHIIRRPSLKIRWRDEGGTEKKAEFIEDISGGSRKKDLKDWARVINLIKSGKIGIELRKSPSPSNDTLEGRILYVMGDMQDKGVFQIEEEVEKMFKVDLDPDAVDSACHTLVAQGFLDTVEDASGDTFYRKRSPLGEDDLSS